MRSALQGQQGAVDGGCCGTKGCTRSKLLFLKKVENNRSSHQEIKEIKSLGETKRFITLFRCITPNSEPSLQMFHHFWALEPREGGRGKFSLISVCDP